MARPARENAALVRRFLTDVVGGGDTDAIASLLTADVEDHHLVFDGSERKTTVAGVGLHALATGTNEVQIADVVASENRVAVRGRVTGTHRESLVDLAPTGRSFEIACAWFCRIEDDRIAEIWSLPDGLGLVKQLDAIPAEFPLRTFPQTGDQQ